MRTQPTLTPELLRETLDYDPDTGVFTWRTPRIGWVKRGDVAGSQTSVGRWSLRLFGRSYLAHRVAWFYVYGVWPSRGLDHRNGDPLDNRIANLREATDAENSQNLHHPYRRTASGRLGVYRERSGRWKALIQVDGRTRYLGMFDTADEAESAYLGAKREMHPFWHQSA